MNFGSFKQFLQFKTIENELKFTAQCRAEGRPTAAARGVAAYHVRLAERPPGPRRGHRARDDVVAC
jgi:hypothetical protein